MISPCDRLSNDGVAIFLFHGVVAANTYKIRNYTRKHLEKDYFAGILSDLKRSGRPLSIDDVVDYCTSGTAFPPRSFVISFDDGFENNYSIACPVLSDMQIPAVFYVTTDFIEHNHMSWIDRIEYCFEACSSGTLKLPWETDRRLFTCRQDKIGILDEVRRYVKNDPAIALDLFVRDIFRQCGIDEIVESNDPLDKKMNWHQVRSLGQSDLFSIGGHTHTHAIMSYLTGEDLQHEVATSLSLLQERAGIFTRHFSYPEGLAHCYSETVIATLKQHGIICCPTAIDGINTAADSLFHLKRIPVV